MGHLEPLDWERRKDLVQRLKQERPRAGLSAFSKKFQDGYRNGDLRILTLLVSEFAGPKDPPTPKNSLKIHGSYSHLVMPASK